VRLRRRQGGTVLPQRHYRGQPGRVKRSFE
jgi:hypothetical protein